MLDPRQTHIEIVQKKILKKNTVAVQEMMFPFWPARVDIDPNWSLLWTSSTWIRRNASKLEWAEPKSLMATRHESTGNLS